MPETDVATTDTSTEIAESSQTTTQAATTGVVDNFINPDGTFKDGWKDRYVPDELKGNKVFDIPSDLKGMAKILGNQAIMIGKYGSTKGVLPINDKSTPMEVEAYRASMGIPKDSTGYKVPEGLQAEPEILKGALDDFNKQNYTQTQVDAALGAYKSYVEKAQADYDTKLKSMVAESENVIRGKWGDKYDQRLHASQKFISKMTAQMQPEEYDALFGKEVTIKNEDGTMTKVREGGLNSAEFSPIRPLVLDLFATIESKYGIEDTAIIDESNATEIGSIEDQITELNKQISDGKLRTSVNPRDRQKHQELLDKKTALIKRLPPKSML